MSRCSCGNETDNPHDVCGRCADRLAEHPEGRLRAVPFSEIKTERTRFLWAGRIPLGAPTLLVGREKLGKSTLIAHLAAGLSKGILDGDLQGKPSHTLIVNLEDSASATTKPRLLAAGADVDQVMMIRATTVEGQPDLLTLPRDTDELRALIREHGIRLVTIDPLSAVLAPGVDNHRDQDLRRVIAPLAQLAEELDIAVVFVSHFNKSQGTDVLSRVLGSRALTAAVRSILAFGVAADAEDNSPDRFVAHAACNVAALAPTLQVQIEQAEVYDGGITATTSKLVMGDEVEMSADEMLITRSSIEAEDRTGAEDWLEYQLRDGEPHPVQDVLLAAAAAKPDPLSRRTIYRAAKKLKVNSDNISVSGEGARAGKTWQIPDVPDNDDTTGGTTDVAHRESPVDTEDSVSTTPRRATSETRDTTGPNQPKEALIRCSCVNDSEVDDDWLCHRCYGIWTADREAVA